MDVGYKSRHPVESCPVCASRALAPKPPRGGIPIAVCGGCGLVLQSPQPSDEELARIYGSNYFIGSGDDAELARQFQQVKRATARLQLDEIERFLAKLPSALTSRRLFEVGCGHGNLLNEARRRGYDVSGLEFSPDAARIANATLGLRDAVRCGTVEGGGLAGLAFDVCVAADVIEHTRDPRRFLEGLRRQLAPGGVLFVTTPSLRSWSARLLRSWWVEYKPEHLFYFDESTLSRLLREVGFDRIEISAGVKALTLGYIAGHFAKFPTPVVSPLIHTASKLMPSSWLAREIRIAASGINVLATRSD